MPNIINAFPLTIYQDAVVVAPAERTRMIEAILAMEPQKIQQTPGSSWTGDTNGHEFLHNEELFRPLFESFRGPIKRYLEILRLDARTEDRDRQVGFDRDRRHARWQGLHRRRRVRQRRPLDRAH